jgi:hypothetical protein
MSEEFSNINDEISSATKAKINEFINFHLEVCGEVLIKLNIDKLNFNVFQSIKPTWSL